MFQTILNRVFLFLALAGILSCVPAIAQDALAKIKAAGSINLGHRESAFPFSFIGTEKRPQGFSVDLCLRVVDAVKRELKMPQLSVNWLHVNNATRVAAVQESKIDIECGATPVTAEQRKQVRFSIPFFYTSTRFIVWEQVDIRNWDELRGKRVVVAKESAAASAVTSRNTTRNLGLTILNDENSQEAFTRFTKRQAEAFADDEVALWVYRANHTNPDSIVVTGDALSRAGYALMLNKDSTSLKTLVDKELARLMIDGEFVRLYDKWFRKNIPARGINLNMPIPMMLREQIQFPTDKTPE